MGLETGILFMHQLVVTNPVSTDFVYEGDDHLRLIKQTLKNTFSNIKGAVDATQADINLVVGKSQILAFIRSSAVFLPSFQTITANGIKVFEVTVPEALVGDLVILQKPQFSANPGVGSKEFGLPSGAWCEVAGKVKIAVVSWDNLDPTVHNQVWRHYPPFVHFWLVRGLT